MSDPREPGSGPEQHNHVSGGTVYANQGRQSINHYNSVQVRARSWTGWAALLFLVLDVAFCLYAQGAYTGRSGDAGDLWRAGIALVLLSVTVSLVRRWFRHRF